MAIAASEEREAANSSRERERVIESLNDLLQIDHDAIAAYEVAAEKLADLAAAEQIRSFRKDHERHVAELNEVVGALGGTARNQPHPSGPFREALQSLGGLAGDKGVLMAWRTNELQVRNRYEAYLSRATQWPAEALRVVERNATDEERHYRWVVEKLAELGVASREGVRPPGADGEGAGEKVRAAAEATGRRLQERVASAAGQLREQLPGGDVGERLRGRVDSTSQRVREQVDATTEQLREQVDGASEQLRGVGADVQRRVRRHPARTLVTAAVAGFVLGRLVR